MLATVGFDRLNKPYVKTRHGRQYQELILAPSDLQAIELCICAYLGLKNKFVTALIQTEP
jgi:hypothetical protein